MKIFAVSARRWLGPGTPHSGIVREETAEKAIEAFINDPDYRWWFQLRPPLETDFLAKEIGFDSNWKEESFNDELRESNSEISIASREELDCHIFLEHRVIFRSFNPGGWTSKMLFSFKLWIAKLLRDLATSLDHPSDKNEVGN